MTQTLVSLIFVGLLVQSARIDIVYRRIPNYVVGLIILLWPLRVLSLEPGAAVAALLIALIVLLVGMLVWIPGWLGAGDAKLLAAVALWAGHEHVAATLLVTLVAGAAIAMALLLIRLWGVLPSFVQASCGAVAPSSSPTRSSAKRAARSVPYGVAIAAGGLWLAAQLVAG